MRRLLICHILRIFLVLWESLKERRVIMVGMWRYRFGLRRILMILVWVIFGGLFLMLGGRPVIFILLTCCRRPELL